MPNSPLIIHTGEVIPDDPYPNGWKGCIFSNENRAVIESLLQHFPTMKLIVIYKNKKIQVFADQVLEIGSYPLHFGGHQVLITKEKMTFVETSANMSAREDIVSSSYDEEIGPSPGKRFTVSTDSEGKELSGIGPSASFGLPVRLSADEWVTIPTHNVVQTLVKSKNRAGSFFFLKTPSFGSIDAK